MTLEVLTGTWAIMSAFVVVLFSSYILAEARRVGFWRGYWQLNAAVGIAVYHLGQAAWMGWFWVYNFLSHLGYEVSWMRRSPALVVFACVALVGLLCKVRVFSRESWGNYAWVALGVVALAAASAGVLIEVLY